MLRSAHAAYRRDLENRSSPFSPNDGVWVAVADLLEQAGLVPRRSKRLIREAVNLAKKGVGAEHRRIAAREFGRANRDGDRYVLLLSDRAYQRGALNTAFALLDALWATVPSTDDARRGRILVRMARINNKLGFLDAAEDQLAKARRLAKAARSSELEVSALIGSGSLAQSRGNYPEMQRCAKRAADLSDRHQLHFLGRFAHTGLMIAAAQREEFGAAMHQAGIVYSKAAGYPTEEAELLQNVGQMLLAAGYTEDAASMFTAVLGRDLPEHFVLAALGGLALASAKQGRRQIVLWASGEVERLEKLGAQRYQSGIALLECAVALLAVGFTQHGERARKAALRLGEQYGYHEVVIRAEHAAQELLVAKSRVLGQAALAVAQSIRAREPGQLPDHVRVAAPV